METCYHLQHVPSCKHQSQFKQHFHLYSFLLTLINWSQINRSTFNWKFINLLIFRYIDAHLSWEEAISVTFLMVDKPDMAHLITKYADTNANDAGIVICYMTIMVTK